MELPGMTFDGGRPSQRNPVPLCAAARRLARGITMTSPLKPGHTVGIEAGALAGL